MHVGVPCQQGVVRVRLFVPSARVPHRSIACLAPPCWLAIVLQAWFHLYRILLTADDLASAEVAPTVEQFMQVGRVAAPFILHCPACNCCLNSINICWSSTPVHLQSAPLGEFAARLGLLDAFRRQLAAMSAGGGADAQVQRWRQLSAVLYNVVRYYRQFEPAVQRQVAAGMAELEKQLQVSGVAACSCCLIAGVRCLLSAACWLPLAAPGPVS